MFIESGLGHHGQYTQVSTFQRAGILNSVSVIWFTNKVFYLISNSKVPPTHITVVKHMPILNRLDGRKRNSLWNNIHGFDAHKAPRMFGVFHTTPLWQA